MTLQIPLLHRNLTATALLFFSSIGAASVAVATTKLTRFLWRHYLRPSSNKLTTRYGSGSTAIVTGATSGLGQSCAEILAQQGWNVVLMARTRKDLVALGSRLREAYGVQVLVVSMDAATATKQDIQQHLLQPLSEKSVGLLVNTLGIHNHRPCTVEDMDWELAEAILNVNCRFMVLLASLLIPRLKENAEQFGHAGILNWSSLTACTPMAYLSTYAATKAFVLHWSRSLAAELQPQHIDVLCAQPGLTATPMSGETAAGGIVADPNKVARNTLGLLGATKQKRVIPTPLHAVFVFLMENLLPESMQDSLNRTDGHQKQKEMDKGT